MTIPSRDLYLRITTPTTNHMHPQLTSHTENNLCNKISLIDLCFSGCCCCCCGSVKKKDGEKKQLSTLLLQPSTTVRLSQVGRRHWCGFLNTLNAASFTLNADVCLFDPLLGIIQIILLSCVKTHQTGLQYSSATFCCSTLSLKALNVMVK